MLRFLPHSNKKIIVKEYFLRTLIFFFLFELLSLILLVALFLPSAFYSKFQKNNIENQLESILKNNPQKESESVDLIRNLNLKVRALYDTKQFISTKNLLDEILLPKDENIKITGISIISDSETSKKISISGVSKTRDDLTNFERKIKVSEYFSSVTLPVSNFIKDSDIDFNINFYYKLK